MARSFADLPPEQILPSQTQRVPEMTPCQRLVLAVMDEAHTNLTKLLVYGSSRNALYSSMRSRQSTPYEDARRWVLSDDQTWPFSFVNLCNILGWDVEATRAAMLRKAL